MKLAPACVALITLGALLVGCVGPPQTYGPSYGPRNNVFVNEPSPRYGSGYDYDEAPAPPPQRQGLSDGQKLALGLGAVMLMSGGGGGGGSDSSDDVEMCSRCGENPADGFVGGICGQCANIQMDQNWGR